MLNRWTTLETDLAGLVAAVDEALNDLTLPLSDGRVRRRPDARTLRYHQTLGLLDRPLRYEGRRAIYGYRHLVQAVAVKVLQSEGLPLAKIQTALAGRSTEALAQAITSAAGDAQAPPPPPPPALEALLRAELAPGVTVLIDPHQVPDPGALLAALSAALPPRGDA